MHAATVPLETISIFDMENNARNWLTENDIKGQHTYGLPVSVRAWMRRGSREANCQH